MIFFCCFELKSWNSRASDDKSQSIIWYWISEWKHLSLEIEPERFWYQSFQDLKEKHLKALKVLIYITPDILKLWSLLFASAAGLYLAGRSHHLWGWQWYFELSLEAGGQGATHWNVLEKARQRSHFDTIFKNSYGILDHRYDWVRMTLHLETFYDGCEVFFHGSQLAIQHVQTPRTPMTFSKIEWPMFGFAKPQGRLSSTFARRAQPLQLVKSLEHKLQERWPTETDVSKCPLAQLSTHWFYSIFDHFFIDMLCTCYGHVLVTPFSRAKASLDSQELLVKRSSRSRSPALPPNDRWAARRRSGRWFFGEFLKAKCFYFFVFVFFGELFGSLKSCTVVKNSSSLTVLKSVLLFVFFVYYLVQPLRKCDDIDIYLKYYLGK